MVGVDRVFDPKGCLFITRSTGIWWSDFRWKQLIFESGTTEESVHEDFKRFCIEVCDAVARKWEQEEEESCSLGDSSILWPTEFAQCATDFERVCVLMKLPGIRRFSLLPAARSEGCRNSLKKDGLSNSLRDAGNDAWLLQNVEDALALYTKALFFAETNKTRAFAYANRSCVLYRLGAHTETIQDIERAFQNDYPHDRRPRLLARRGQSLLAMNQIDAARAAFMEARQMIRSNSFVVCSQEIREQVEKGLLKCAQLSQRPDTHTDPPVSSPLFIRQHEVPTVTQPRRRRTKKNKRTNSKNQRSPSQESHGTAAYKWTFGGQKAGWHLQASRNIEAGEVILIEKPYARRICRRFLLKHCYQCFKRCLNLLPCRKCSEVGFCSTECEKTSWLPDARTKSSTSSDVSEAPSSVVRCCHRYECGQISRVDFYDFAGWQWMQQNELPTGASKFVQRYRMRLMVRPPDRNVVPRSMTWLPFACIARTDQKHLKSLIQDTLAMSTDGAQCASARLLAFSSQNHCLPLDETDDDYLSIGRLSVPGGRVAPQKLWQLTVAAVFLAHCLSAGGYELDWEKHCLSNMSDEVSTALPASWAAACLLHDLQTVSLLATDLLQLEYTTPSICRQFPNYLNESNRGISLMKGHRLKVGFGIYPMQAILLHSCDPNTLTVTTNNGTAVLFAMRPIKKGETLHRTFGVHYFHRDRIWRRLTLLMAYNFECQCNACKEDWPVPFEDVNIRCQNCQRAICLTGRQLQVASERRPHCHCPEGLQQRFVHQYMRIRSDVSGQIQQFTDYCQRIPFDQLSIATLDKNIEHYLQLLNNESVESLMMPPSLSVELINRSLDTGLQLRYGCTFAMTDMSLLSKTDEELSECQMS
ncbi:SET and MYND domain-containing protein 4 [Clonorchis sinensis]|uniref:Protein-lysine N-methyltransferase SMYD4 n=1 Tax=Clonorchis sinensis TaxID=79923 RepID=G7YLQ6_CLOSI|nr:SET and MYND domain-containing protein 4 [Clonorchis sinensis]